MQKEALQIQYNITLSLSGLITWNFYRVSHPYIKNFTPLYPIKKKVCFSQYLKQIVRVWAQVHHACGQSKNSNFIQLIVLNSS